LPGILGRARLRFVFVFHDPIIVRAERDDIRYLPKKTLRCHAEDEGGPG
jgi:hypothetical protein